MSDKRVKSTKEKIEDNGNLAPLRMTKTITQKEVLELRNRYSALVNADTSYRAAKAYYRDCELEVQRTNQFPDVFTVDLRTAVVSWEQPQVKEAQRG